MAGASVPHGGRLIAAQAAWPSAPRPWLDLSTGINPHGWRKGRASLDSLTRLPDPEETAALEATAAAAFGVDPERVAAVAGAEAGLRLLPSLLNVRHAAIASPTYGSHANAWRLAGVEVVAVERAALAQADAGVLVVVNPNNPDGALSAPEDLIAAAGDRWLVVDESFGEVAPGFSAAPLASERTVVLRSFGKFHGLPGARLGFVVADPELANRVRRRVGDWPVGADAIAFGRAAYADTGWAERTRKRLEGEAMRLDRLLIAAGFRIVGGTSLFRLVAAEDAAARASTLAEQGVLVRTFDHDPSLIRFGLPHRAGWPRLEAALEFRR